MKHLALIQAVCFVVTLGAVASSIQASGEEIKVTTNAKPTTVAPTAQASAGIAKTVTHAPASVAPAPAPPATSTSAPKVEVKATTAGSPTAPSVTVAVTSKPASSPAVTSNVSATAATANATVAAAAAAPVAGHPVVAAAAGLSPAQKLAQYFEPICTQIENLQPKHMFKVQSQVKQFIEKVSVANDSSVIACVCLL